MNENQARQVGLLLAMIRTAIGLTTLVAPSLARLWVGAPGATPGGRALSRSLAVREIVLGCGRLFSGSNSVRLRTWLAAGLCAIASTRSERPALLGCRARRAVLVTLTSGAAAVAGAAAALSLPDQKSRPGALSAVADRPPA